MDINSLEISHWDITEYQKYEENIEFKEHIFNPRVYGIRNGGEIEIKPPTNIFTSLILYPLMLKPNT